MAKEADLESIILLKNEENVLPLNKNKSTKVALLGPLLKENTKEMFESAVGNNNIKDVSELKKEEATAENKEVEPVINEDLAKAAYGRWKQLKDKSNDILVISPSNDLRDKISYS